METGFGRWRGLGRIQTAVKRILDLEKGMKALSDTELSRKTQEFRSRLEEGEMLDGLLPEAFAAVREAARA